MAENTKPLMPKMDNAKEFMVKVKKNFQSHNVDKSIVKILMSKHTTKKFDWSQLTHYHVIGMVNLATKLTSMGIDVSESFIVYFIINSFPPEFGQFR